MSFIGTDWDLEGVEEDKPVPEGEYTLVVSDVKEKEDESGNPKGLLVILEIEGHDEAANVLHNISFPLPGDDASKLKNKRLFMKRFLTTFGIPFANGIDLTRFPGARAKVKLKQEEYNGTVSNTIHLPKLG